jgi:hypothetical protein
MGNTAFGICAATQKRKPSATIHQPDIWKFQTSPQIELESNLPISKNQIQKSKNQTPKSKKGENEQIERLSIATRLSTSSKN